MHKKTAIIIGATGLVGNLLLQMLLRDDKYGSVVGIMRKPPHVTHPKLTTHVLNFKELANYAHLFSADDAFCCLGTTMRQAGSKDAFYEVDYHYVTQFAQLTAQGGAKQFLLVSAMGANAQSIIYYNRVKGETENFVRQQPFYTIHIFRPSLLLGDRREKRMGEDVGKVLDGLLGWAIPKKYKGIAAEKVARAMQLHAHENVQGIFVHESDQLQNIG